MLPCFALVFLILQPNPHASQLLDPTSKKPVRTIFRFLPDGTRVRVGVGPNASDAVIPIPFAKEDTSKLGLCESHWGGLLVKDFLP